MWIKMNIAIISLFMIQCAYCDIVPITRLKGESSNKQDESIIKERERETLQFWTNPCTGSISTEEKPIWMLPCLNATTVPSSSPAPSVNSGIIPIPPQNTTAPTSSPTTPAPTSSPTTSPTKSPTTSPTKSPTKSPTTSPTKSPTMSPTPRSPVDEIVCPGESCSFDENNEDHVEVDFKYSIETTSAITNADDVLPRVEEALLQKLAEELLHHCLDKSQISKTFLGEVPAYRRRVLLKQNRRRLQSVGLCSRPPDVVIVEETCDPELDQGNNCYVIQGGVTVAIEPDDSAEAISSTIKGVTKEAMDNDDLLTDDNPDVKKVTYIDDDNDDESAGVVLPPNSQQKSSDWPIILFSSVGVIALLLGGAACRSKKDSFVCGTAAAGGIIVGDDSIEVADAGKLGIAAYCMDVHECKSAFCPKCYVDPDVVFVNAPKTARPPPSTKASSNITSGGWGEPPSVGASFSTSSGETEDYSKNHGCC